jgi:hypothetical protein
VHMEVKFCVLLLDFVYADGGTEEVHG